MTATESDLISMSFRGCSVIARKLDIRHPVDPAASGPSAIYTPRRLCLVRGRNVMYVGASGELRQITQGRRMNRAANDYTYVPPSKVLQLSCPRVWVNGLLNRAFKAKRPVSWWWLETGSKAEALQLEAQLINRWNPPWNRTFPGLRQSA